MPETHPPTARAGAYRLLDGQRLEAAMAGLRLGHPLEYRAEVTSTSDLAWAAAARGDAEGAVFIAETQTAGRGRLGREWSSPPGVGLWLSFLLRPGIEPTRWPLLTVAAALAAAEAIGMVAGLAARIRWPNDVVLDDRKVAGVLAETRGQVGGADAVVLGIGVNVNQEAGDFPEELRAIATSVRLACGGRATDRETLFAVLVRALELRYAQVRAADLTSLAEAWRRYSALLGRRVRVTVQGADTDGEVVDVHPVAGISVRTAGGPTIVFRAEKVERLALLG